MPRGTGYQSEDSGTRKSARKAKNTSVLVFNFIGGATHVYHSGTQEDFSVAAAAGNNRTVAAVDLAQCGIQAAEHLSSTIAVQFIDTSSELSQDSINARISAK